MKPAILFVLAVLLAQSALAEEAYFYVAAANGIYRDSIDTNTGKLDAPSLVCAANNPNFLAFSPNHEFLYASLNNDVASFDVKKDGSLAPLSEVASGGAGACYVSVDGTGRNVLVADYAGGCIACFRANPDGSIGPRTAFIAFTGSGPDLKRQMQPHAHSIYADSSNKFVYACDLGSDHVWIFKFDAARGSLVPGDPPKVKAPPGSGPRHLAFGLGERFVYVSNEMGHSVTVFARNIGSGGLIPLQTVSTLSPGTPTQDVTTAEIVLHPSGKWLYVSNRGCETISLFSIAPDGSVALTESVPSPAKFPRNFALDPSGCWLIVGGQKDNRLAVMKIDLATGRLTPTDQAATVTDPTCVLFYGKRK